MDTSQEITLIIIGNIVFVLTAIGFIMLIQAYQKKQRRFIFEKIGCSGTRLQTIPAHHEN
jgi:hypothetical protein